MELKVVNYTTIATTLKWTLYTLDLLNFKASPPVIVFVSTDSSSVYPFFIFRMWIPFLIHFVLLKKHNRELINSSALNYFR